MLQLFRVFQTQVNLAVLGVGWRRVRAGVGLGGVEPKGNHLGFRVSYTKQLGHFTRWDIYSAVWRHDCANSSL